MKKSERQIWYEKGFAEASKAFGGCKKCYGKGYATVRYGTKGFEDFGGEGFITKQKINMHFCSCERGKQLKELLNKKA